MSKPPLTKSVVFMFPVANAMAFGGVEIGKHMAAEAPRARGITMIGSKPTATAMPRGARIFVAAVLLIKFDSKVVT
jgi:hypothetical protein